MTEIDYLSAFIPGKYYLMYSRGYPADIIWATDKDNKKIAFESVVDAKKWLEDFFAAEWCVLSTQDIWVEIITYIAKTHSGRKSATYKPIGSCVWTDENKGGGSNA